ncbi:MAG: 50S ribosomal protein L33 [Coxiella sp. RIFCSPHIGHO2_12_FULL_42_15]|nr:MAG: 50S ribosomal protein L33 [Coxiella sp. RIFCSPHIGHO2_12_FULL_42_15]
MAKKDRRKKIMMVSEGVDKKGRPTKTTYYTTKGDTQEKLALSKYDPAAYDKETDRYGLHVKFNEKKLPK